MLLCWAQPVQAQDITVLVVALVPPILLAPVCLVLARWFWLRRGSQAAARLLPLILVSLVEVLPWVAFIASALVIMTGDGKVGAVFWPVICSGGLWLLSSIWFDRSQRATRWLSFAFPPAVLLLLAAATCLALITVEW